VNAQSSSRAKTTLVVTIIGVVLTRQLRDEARPIMGTNPSKVVSAFDAWGQGTG
jgi:hypothetical protein